MLSAARAQFKGSLCFLEALTAYHQGRAIYLTLPANAPAALAPTLSHLFYLRLRPTQAVLAALQAVDNPHSVTNSSVMSTATGLRGQAHAGVRAAPHARALLELSNEYRQRWWSCENA